MPLIPTNTKRINQSQELNYKNLVKKRFKDQVELIVKKYKLQQLVLILDINTTLIISNLFKIPQLVQMKIIYLQRLEFKRKRMPLLHGLYYITPTINNIQSLKSDFPSKSLVTDQQQKKQYKKIHIFLTSFISRDLMKQIATHKPLLSRISRNSFKQFYHSVKFISSNTINFDVQYMKLAYSKQNHVQNQKRLQIANKIMEFIVNLGQINTVRIYYKKSQNLIAQNVALYTQKAINKYVSSLLQCKSHLLNKQADDITLLLFDRSLDPITPLMHGFSYESLLFDLLKVTFQGSKNSQNKQYYKFKQFDDQIYHNYRYKHISKALQELPALLNKQNQKLLQIQKSKSQQNQIDITQLNQKVNSLRKHIDMLDILFKQFKNKQLNLIGQLQQSLATGLTQQGKNTSSSKLYIDVVENIQKNIKLTKNQKLRLALIVLACIKLSKKDYEKLLDLFVEQQDKWVLKNIIALGITYDKSIGKSTKAITKDQQNIALKRLQQLEMPLDRYTTILQLIIPMVLQILSGQNPKVKRLDPGIFGSLKCLSLQQESSLDNFMFKKQRFVIIMLGGISFTEISALRRIDSLKNIIIGADQIISPEKYLQNLKQIDILK